MPFSLNAGYMGIFATLKEIHLPNINNILQIMYDLHEGQESANLDFVIADKIESRLGLAQTFSSFELKV